MITIIARWETSQMPPTVEWQMWRQLRGAFKVQRVILVPVLAEMKDYHVEQCETMEEALASCEGVKTFLEPQGEKQISDMHHWWKWRTEDGHDLTLVLGNTETGNAHLVGEDDYTVKINTPQRTHLYGISAAAIALAYRVGQ